MQLRGVASVETAAIEMEAVAVLSRRCKDPVYHLIVAYAKGEHPTREQVISDAERLLKAIGMERNQYVLAAHQDTDNYHAHVIANRIGPNGKANDLWQERIKRERVCAEIAAERGWEIVVGRHNRDIVQRVRHLYAPPPDPERRLSDGTYRRLRERGELPWQDSARPYVLDAVDRAKSWSELHERLAAHGVVAKLVRRSDRIRGLAFAEGFERGAPGCAASRVDALCALPALKRRFGSFTPSHEVAREMIDATQWVQSARATILAAVDGARSWDELTQRLDRDGIVVKLIARGTRVQGLAFAQGRDPGAPGCGASRIHPCCKKAALEQRFGPCPFTPEQAPKRSRSSPRDRAEREANTDPRRALRDAQGIVGHARMRTEYTQYRDRFFGDRHRATAERREAAWQRERVQRQCEAKRRHEARLLLRAVARLAARGAIARQLAYWSIDAIMNRRRTREYDAGRVRWDATKTVLASERKLMREEKPMDYRSFVTQRARAGDLGAQRALDALKAPARTTQERATEARWQPVTVDEVRKRLQAIRAEEEARYEHARIERQGLTRIDGPPTIEQAVASARNDIQARVSEAMQFTPAERADLARLTKEQQSWNPFVRGAAKKEAGALHAGQHARYKAELARSIHEFESGDAQRLQERIRSDERSYREYVSASLGLEAEMRTARAVLREDVPKIEKQLTVLERTGVAQLECEGAVWGAGLDKLATAVERSYREVPEAVRRDVEFGIRREQQALARVRSAISMDR
ncbi:MAG TPA: relaxase/mobilization nuclease domain-containing protein [Candidatus Binatia bacterium]|nr:relaxase/mobilization nuclease domain-containing protein [Candidatus Binatia bacterium]